MSKYCIKCGAELEDNAMFCDDCGAQQMMQSAPIKEVASNQVKMSNADNKKMKESGYGIASLVLGIISVLTLGALFLPELLGIIFGICGLRDKSKKTSLALTGLILSIVATVLLVIVLIV